MFCQHCGHELSAPEEIEEHAAEEAADAAENVAETVSSSEVEIARINADRDVTLARIEKGIMSEMTEAAAEENAVKAEILDEAMTPPEPEPVPVVVEDAPAEEPVTEAPPPPAEESPEPAGKRNSNPWW